MANESNDQSLSVMQSFVVEEQSPFDLSKLADSFRHRNTGWTIPEAYLAVLVSSAVADGNFHAEEQEEIMRLARRSRALRAMSPTDLAAANERVNQRLQSNPQALSEAASTLPGEMCLPVFAHCVDIILADGDLTKSEGEFLDSLVPLLDIDATHARRIMEVLLLKAQY